MKLGIVMDSIETIKFVKDSSLAMLLEAGTRGYSLFYMQQEDLYWSGKKAMGKMRPLQVFNNPEKWFEFGEPIQQPLGSLDVILMRKDPPFDMDYIFSTYLLEMAEQDGVLVVNRSQSIRDANEKLFACQFPQCTPETLVSCNAEIIRSFIKEHKDVILKPLDGMGGTSVFRCTEKDPNIGVIIEGLTLYGKRQIMAQVFIPEIVNGDKRILLIDGEPIPYALARIPAKGETRANLAVGGTGEGVALSDRDQWICQQVGPTLKEKGLIFVGLDVIGDYLTEINVTSPTCIRELDSLYNINISGTLMDCIEQKLG